MELNDIKDAFNPMVESIKKDIEAIDKKNEARINEMNEDAKKKGEKKAQRSKFHTINNMIYL